MGAGAGAGAGGPANTGAFTGTGSESSNGSSSHPSPKSPPSSHPLFPSTTALAAAAAPKRLASGGAGAADGGLACAGTGAAATGAVCAGTDGLAAAAGFGDANRDLDTMEPRAAAPRARTHRHSRSHTRAAKGVRREPTAGPVKRRRRGVRSGSFRCGLPRCCSLSSSCALVRGVLHAQRVHADYHAPTTTFPHTQSHSHTDKHTHAHTHTPSAGCHTPSQDTTRTRHGTRRTGPLWLRTRPGAFGWPAAVRAAVHTCAQSPSPPRFERGGWDPSPRGGKRETRTAHMRGWGWGLGGSNCSQ